MEDLNIRSINLPLVLLRWDIVDKTNNSPPNFLWAPALVDGSTLAKVRLAQEIWCLVCIGEWTWPSPQQPLQPLINKKSLSKDFCRCYVWSPEVTFTAISLHLVLMWAITGYKEETEMTIERHGGPEFQMGRLHLIACRMAWVAEGRPLQFRLFGLCVSWALQA